MRALRALCAGAGLALVPGAAFAAGGGDGGLLAPTVNFVILVAVIVYFARKPLLGFFAERRVQIQTDLESAAAMRAEAEERFAHWQRKIADLDTELADLRAKSRDLGEAERQRILADAAAAAERIRNDARAAVDQELRSAREKLREESADLAIELAAKLLDDRVQDADRNRLVDEFIERVESAPPAAGNGRA